jgi:hypothetical protein
MTKIIRYGKVRGEKVLYPDGVGCTIWYPFEQEGEGEDAGICFDFAFEDIDDLIGLLQKIKETEADIYQEEEEEPEPW